MTELLTAAQMRAIEKAAIDSGAVTGLELMERAGRGVVEAIFDEWPELGAAPHCATILCGPGNNGGDGFVVARLLHACGWEVAVYFYGDAAKLPPDALVNYERWRAIGEVRPACGVGALGSRTGTGGCDLMVDAVFGTGLARAVEDPCLWEWFWLIDDALDVAELEEEVPVHSVAVDIPSGLDADTGEVMGGAPEHGLRAPQVMLSVTFHSEKYGHRLRDGPEYCGKVVVKDIGL